MENDNLVPEVDVIENRKKLSPEVKESIVDSIFYNVVVFIIMLLITLIINITFNKFSLTNFENYMKFVQISLSIITVGIFEVAYKKDTMKIGLYGIEFFIYSIAILFVPYMYISIGKLEFLKCIILIFTIYYAAKSLVTFLMFRYNYLKDNISDVKEIVKDEAKGYLDEESKKTLRERKVEDELKKKAKTEKIKNKAVSKNIDTTKKAEVKSSEASKKKEIKKEETKNKENNKANKKSNTKT